MPGWSSSRPLTPETVSLTPPLQQPTRSLWIGNLDPKTSPGELQAVFAPYGAIESLRLIPEKVRPSPSHRGAVADCFPCRNAALSTLSRLRTPFEPRRTSLTASVGSSPRRAGWYESDSARWTRRRQRLRRACTTRASLQAAHPSLTLPNSTSKARRHAPSGSGRFPRRRRRTTSSPSSRPLVPSNRHEFSRTSPAACVLLSSFARSLADFSLAAVHQL